LTAGDDEGREVVATVGALDPVVVLLREFLHRSGALRAVAVVDRAPGEGPAVVDCGRALPIEVDLGDRTVVLPHALALDVPSPDVPEVRRLPPFDVDRAEATVAAPLGGVDHLAGAVAALATRLGGRNVAMVQFETSDPATPLAVSARADGSEPVVVALGDDEYEL
jgi:hypothetical protein